MLFQILNKVWEWNKETNPVPIVNTRVFYVKTN